jgi:hypothetical protein
MALYDPEVKSAETQPDLSTPSLEALAFVLEHPEAWPKGWAWDFSRATHKYGTAGCALGIADALWKRERHRDFINDYPTWHSVFIRGAADSDITPQIVAARIRDHLAGRPIRYS